MPTAEREQRCILLRERILKNFVFKELKLLDASVRHLGTDINYIVLENLYKELKEKVEFRFNYRVDELEAVDGGYRVISGDSTDECEECIISVGRKRKQMDGESVRKS